MAILQYFGNIKLGLGFSIFQASLTEVVPNRKAKKYGKCVPIGHNKVNVVFINVM